MRNLRILTLGSLLIIVALFSLNGQLSAQLFTPKSQLERQFDKGVHAYEHQHFEEALQIFQNLYQNHRGFSETTANHLMLIKTYHQLGLDRKSINLSKQFIAQYPASSYIDDIYYAMAESYYALKEYKNSASAFAATIVHSNDNTLTRTSLEYLLKISDSYLSLDDVQSLVDGAIQPEAETIFRLALLQKYIQTGEMSLASTTAMELEMSIHNDQLQPTFRALKKAISLDSKAQVTIAVLAPLSGASANVGTELVNGVRYALAEANDLPQVSIITLDNQASSLKTVHELQRITHHQRVIAIIGPVYSENVIAGAALADFAKLPLVTPTATEDGLAGLSPYVFQLSPDYETRGRATAQFAIDSLGLHTFAVLAPADPQGKGLTDAFSQEVEKRGGNVVSEVWFSGTPEDLTDQFQHLRDVGFSLMTPDTVDTSSIVSDSLRSTLTDSEFVQLFNERMQEKAEKIDSSAIRISTIDGIYFPVNSGDIDYIAPQFAFHNFNTQVLGNVEWYNQAKLRQYSTYIDRIVIFSDYFMPDQSTKFQRFVNDYRKRIGETPVSLDLYGYDTMNLLLGLIRNGYTSRQSIQSGLSHLDQVQGITRTFTLDGERKRVNQSLQILQFLRNRVTHVATMTTGPQKVNPIESYISE